MNYDKEIQIMNMWLERDYGYFEATYPLFRIVFSDYEIEKRLVQHTDEGFELITPQVVERPKYRQYIQGKYILERIVPVPPNTDLVGKTSYEPVWVFEDKDGNTLPPNYDVCKIVVATVYAQAAVATGAKYQDPRANPNFKEEDRARLDKLKEELFGNETSVTDALAARTGVFIEDKDAPKL